MAFGQRWSGWLLLGLAAIFVFAGKASIALARPADSRIWLGYLIWCGSALAGAIILERRLPKRDPLLFPLAMLLSGWGLVAIERLAPAFAERQALWLIVSVIALLLAALFPHILRWLRSYRYVLLALALLLLLATIVIGRKPLRL